MDRSGIRFYDEPAFNASLPDPLDSPLVIRQSETDHRVFSRRFSPGSVEYRRERG